MANKNLTANGNLKSPDYVKAVKWLRQIWSEFDQNVIRNSFRQCRITNQDNFHSALRELIDDKVKKNNEHSDYVRDIIESDEMDGFDPDACDIFDKEEETELEAAERKLNNEDRDASKN